MADQSIEVIFKLIDETRESGSPAANANSAANKANNAGSEALKTMTVASAALSAGIVASLADAAKSASDAEQSFLELNKQLGVSPEEFRKISTEVSSLGASLGLGVKESANLGAEIAKAGISSEKLDDVFKDLRESSVALSIDQEKMTDKFMQMYTSFGDKTKGMMADINMLADNSATGSLEIINAFAGISPVINQLGLNTKQVMSEMTVALEKGFQPSRVQNAYKDLITTLSNYEGLTRNARAAMDDLYASTGTTYGEILKTQGIQAAMDDFRNKVASIQDPVERLNKIQMIFGKQYASELSAMLGEQEKVAKYQGLIADDTKNAAAFAKEFQKQSQTTAHQAKVLSANWDMLKVAIGQAILPAVNSLLQVITPIVQKFAEFASQNPQIVAVGVAIAAIVATISGLLAIIGAVATGVSAIGGLIGGIITLVGGVGTVLGGVTVGVAALAASPALVVAAVVAAVAAIVALIVMNWDRIKSVLSVGLEWFKGAWNGLKNVLAAFWNWVKMAGKTAFDFLVAYFTGNLASYFGITQQLQGMFTNMWTGIKTVALNALNGIAGFFTSIFTSIGTQIQQHFAFWGTLIQGLYTAVTTMFSQIIVGVQAFWTQLTTMIQSLLTSITTALQSVLTTVTTVFNQISAAIVAAFQSLPSVVASVFQTIVSTITTAMQNVVATITNTFQTIVTGIQTTFSNITSTITGIFNGIVDAIKNILGGGVELIKGLVNAGVEVVKNVISSMVDFVIGLLGKLVSQAGQSGAAMMSEMANGVRSNSHLVSEAVADAAAQSNQYLPQSPAKKGALRNLDKTGFGLMDTFAKGIRGYNIIPTMNRAMQKVNNGLQTNGQVGGYTAGNKGGQSQQVSINYAPVIQTRDEKETLRALNNNQRQLLRIISDSERNINRSFYGA